MKVENEKSDTSEVYKDAPPGFPNTLKIFNYTWDIAYATAVPTNDDGEEYDLLGKCDLFTKTIVVDINQGRERLRETLLHEICHAYAHSVPGLELKLKHEEKFCDLFAAIFIDFVRNNVAFWEE